MESIKRDWDAGRWREGGPRSREPRTWTWERLIECQANKSRQFHAPLSELASASQSHRDETPSEVGII